MTSLAFIFGVTPMVWGVGAGAELRQTLGTTVFSGMIGVTLFGLIFTPAFYVIARWIAQRASRRRPEPGLTAPAE
jgi:multidrug efflux pump subunit AcrB